MLLKLIRKEVIRENVYGELTTDGQKICDTLENKPYLIPELMYRVQVTQSPKFRRPLPEICSVPGRSGIRMHVGNTAKDSTGCVLVGVRCSNGLRDSSKTEKLVTDMLNQIQQSREEIRIEVTHFEPTYEGYPY